MALLSPRPAKFLRQWARGGASTPNSLLRLIEPRRVVGLKTPFHLIVGSLDERDQRSGVDVASGPELYVAHVLAGTFQQARWVRQFGAPEEPDVDMGREGVDIGEPRRGWPSCSNSRTSLPAARMTSNQRRAMVPNSLGAAAPGWSYAGLRAPTPLSSWRSVSGRRVPIPARRRLPSVSKPIPQRHVVQHDRSL